MRIVRVPRPCGGIGRSRTACGTGGRPRPTSTRGRAASAGSISPTAARSAASTSSSCRTSASCSRSGGRKAGVTDEIPPGSAAVEVTFVEEGGDTVMTLRHTGLPRTVIELHGAGWGHHLPMLVAGSRRRRPDGGGWGRDVVSRVRVVGSVVGGGVGGFCGGGWALGGSWWGGRAGLGGGAFRAAHVFDGEQVRPGGAVVLVDNGRILGVESIGFTPPDGCEVSRLRRHGAPRPDQHPRPPVR